MLSDSLRKKAEVQRMLLDYALNDLGSLDDWLVGSGFIDEITVSDDVPDSLTVVCRVMSDVAHPVIEYKGERLAYWHKAQMTQVERTEDGLKLQLFTKHSMRIVLVPLIHKDGQ